MNGLRGEQMKQWAALPGTEKGFGSLLELTQPVSILTQQLNALLFLQRKNFSESRKRFYCRLHHLQLSHTIYRLNHIWMFKY